MCTKLRLKKIFCLQFKYLFKGFARLRSGVDNIFAVNMQHVQSAELEACIGGGHSEYGIKDAESFAPLPYPVHKRV